MEDTQTHPEIQTMQKVIDSDATALEELYDRYSQILYTLTKKIVDDKTVAEELLVDVFLLVWKKGNSFDLATNNLYTWLVRLAYNKAVDRKKRKISPEALPEYTDEYEDKFIIPKLSKTIEAKDLESVMGVKLKFEDAVNKLTETQKYVINLAYYEGKTQSDIANQLNIPLPTVKSKVQVAMSNLKHNFASGK
jgi:RNA polymerase sigma-70 factor (ECF subfamily)